MQHSLLRRCSLPSVLLLALLTACVHPAGAREITRDRAIEIARSQVPFPVTSVTVVRHGASGRRAWRVTFRGTAAGQPPELFEILIVDVDRRTGEIVSLSRS